MMGIQILAIELMINDLRQPAGLLMGSALERVSGIVVAADRLQEAASWSETTLSTMRRLFERMGRDGIGLRVAFDVDHGPPLSRAVIRQAERVAVVLAHEWARDWSSLINMSADRDYPYAWALRNRLSRRGHAADLRPTSRPGFDEILEQFTPFDPNGAIALACTPDRIASGQLAADRASCYESGSSVALVVALADVSAAVTPELIEEPDGAVSRVYLDLGTTLEGGEFDRAVGEAVRDVRI